MRVGRAALDEEAIRLIEEHNPDVDFDWPRILKGQGVEEPAPPPSRERERPGRRRDQPPRPAPPPIARGASEPEPIEPAVVEPEPDHAELDGVPGDEPVGAVAVPEDDAAEAVAAEREDAASQLPTAAFARLGSEGLSRLRARHAEILARISERIPDPVRQDELKAQAERLNPDVWVTDEEVGRGLEDYEVVYAALRTAVGQGQGLRRRRKRHRPASPAESPIASRQSPVESPVDRRESADEGETNDSTDDQRSD